LSTAEAFQQRIIFVKICGISADHVEKELFQPLFLSCLLVLFKDKVANIRIAVARALVEILKREHYKSDSRIISAVKSLKSDKDRDVVAAAVL